MKITNLQVFHVKPRWSFLKISTDEGITGWGEPMVEGRARTVETAIIEQASFLIGKDPLRIEYLWQSMYRNTFYRGGIILTSAISGIEQALWDIKGKYYNMPIYEMLGGKYREKVRMYGHCWGATTEKIIGRALERKKNGFTAFKVLLEPYTANRGVKAYIESQKYRFAKIRKAVGDEIDIAIDFHGRVNPDVAIQIIKEIEKKSNGYLQFKEGTLYPALHRLERANLVKGKWQKLSTGQERRYYYITEKGRKAFDERLTAWQGFSQAVNLIMQPTST